MKKYRLAVSVLVLKPSSVCAPDGCTVISSILLVHKPRKRDSWQLPQGGVEEGETPEVAALRELQEETGLVLSTVNHSSTCIYSYDFPPEFVKRHNPVNAGQKLCFVVVEAPKDAKVKPDGKEIDNHAWVLPEQVSQYIHRAEYLKVIEDVYAEYLKLRGNSAAAGTQSM